MHFDWYQATVFEQPEALFQALGSEAGELVDRVEMTKGRHGYDRMQTCYDAQGNRIFEVLSGGRQPHPHVVTSGRHAHQIAEGVRSFTPDHRVSRVDVAEDVVGETAFDDFVKIGSWICKKAGVKGLSIIPDDPSEGRTYMMGSKTSDKRVRIYEKSAEMRSKLPRHRHSEVPNNIVRIEQQFRPRKSQKEWAAVDTPEQLWGYSAWTSRLLSDCLGLEVPKIDVRAYQDDDKHRALAFMVKQYRRHLIALKDDVGDWASVGRELGRRIDES